MKKVLVTGATGFAGSYLAEHLLSKRYETIGTYIVNDLTNVNSIKDRAEFRKLDIANAKAVSSFVKEIKPDFIFHLAALTSPKKSFDDPQVTVTNNIIAEMNILNAVKENKLTNTKTLIVSSADIYGMVSKNNLPIAENAPLMPLSPYSVSKIAQDFLGLQYFLAYKLKIIRVRPFNHIGPRQSSHFVVSSIAKKIAEIEKGISGPILKVGNLEAKRDFTDVRDMVKAYLLLLEKGALGEVYNVGSGASYKINDILKMLLYLSKSKIKVEKDKSLFRPIDIPDLVCDSSKFRKVTGWKPEIKIERTLKDTLDYWRNIV